MCVCVCVCACLCYIVGTKCNTNRFSVRGRFRVNVRVGLGQGCQTQFLEGHSPAEFSSNPAPTQIPCSFQISLNDLISWIRCL